MSGKIEISRNLAENIANYMEGSASTTVEQWHRELRSIIAAPVVERKPPIAYMRNEGTPDNLVKCTFTCPGAFGVYREPPALIVPTDDQILEAMRPGIYHADGGYVFDTAKEDVIAAGRALIDKVKELNK